MDKNRFFNLLQNSQGIYPEAIPELEQIVKKHPYFQASKAIYLKNLKSTNNFKYNKALKETAAITTDRTVLFNFINSFVPFKEKTTKENFFKKLVKKEPQKTLKEELQIGAPLDFNNNENHSFTEWLQLSKMKPIQRTLETPKNSILEKIDLIDKFIEENPSITPIEKDEKPIKIKKEQLDKTGIMTETLAKVYLEQKKYNNAIKAYKILILKYPEKSGFFADQIKKIELLKLNKS